VHKLAVLCVGLLCLWSHPGAADPLAQSLIRKLQDLLRSKTNVGHYHMHVIRPTWQRRITFMNWEDVINQRAFIRILAPPKDAGTTFLKVRSNLWTYLPQLERDLKLPPALMLRPWMGSDFTNDDVVKVASIVEDYTHATIGQQAVGEDEVFTIASLPKPDAAVVWGKVVHRLTAAGLPLEAEFYDEHGKLVRRLVYDNVQQRSGRRFPARWTMQPMSTPEQRTALEVETIEFDVAIPESVFERANLSRIGQ
jgi:hypothetical protein